MRKKRTNYSRRLSFYWLVCCFMLALLVLRLFDVQLLDRENLKLQAFKQFTYEVSLPPERGKIFDRNHKLLAMNVPSVNVVAHPGEIADQEKFRVAANLARLFGKSTRYFLNRLKMKSDFVYVARHQPVEIRDVIEKLDLPGVECQASLSRRYPKGRAACQIIGFTGVENKGLSGIELGFDLQLNGTPGKAILQRTATSKAFVRAEYPVIPPENGYDIILTIDYRYQRIAETELHRTILESNADSGAVVIMDPRTGEILAMASEPSFDPNRAGEFHPASWRLRTITDQYEPGSTFKVALMAAVLDRNLHSPDDVIFCENGTWEVMGEKIRDTKPHGWLTLRDIIVKSSNIGMAKLAKDMDRHLFYDYLFAFGFGSKPGTELIGETAGVLKRPRDWSGFTPLVMAFGHEVTASPLQMCNMYATIANGGVLLQPTIVKGLQKKGRETRNRVPRIVRRVIRKETADTLKNFLQQVVLAGTGKKAAIPNVEVCGKTGTAKIVLKNGRGYGNRYNASFGGFFPKTDPQVVMYVVVNSPKSKFYGGEVAAPCFRRIAEQIIALDGLEGVPAEIENLVGSPADEELVPNFLGLTRKRAYEVAKDQGIRLDIRGHGRIILSQKPEHGKPFENERTLVLFTEDVAPAPSGPVVPRLRGLLLRNALTLLKSQGIKAVVNGSGKVVAQKPAPGHVLGSEEQVLLICETAVDLRELMAL